LGHRGKRFWRVGRADGVLSFLSRTRCTDDVARMSEATSGVLIILGPACRFAHAGYLLDFGLKIARFFAAVTLLLLMVSCARPQAVELSVDRAVPLRLGFEISP
jgi:hypothetical protein